MRLFVLAILLHILAGGPAHGQQADCLTATPEQAAEVAALRALEAQGCTFRCSGCGCRGGPGYRNPENERCVGWAELNRVCGPPPHAGCIRECRPTTEACDQGADLLRDGDGASRSRGS